MISARIQQFCRKYDINIGCFDFQEMNPGNINRRSMSLFIYNNEFCLIWKSKSNSFNEAIKKLKLNSKVVDNVISDKHVKSFIKNEYKPKKVQSPLTIIILYDIETYNEDRGVPYCSCIYKLSKIPGKYNRDKSEKRYQKCLKDGVVFKVTDCTKETLDHVLSFKREAKKVNNKIVENNRYLLAHNGSGFDNFVVLNYQTTPLAKCC